MKKFKYFVELNDGFRKTMELEEEHEMSFTIEAENRVTADRMVKAMLKGNPNVKSFDGVCIG